MSSFVKIHSAVVEKKPKNVSANQRPERPSWISDRHEKHKLDRGRRGLASCQVSSKSIQQLRRRSRKMLQPIRGQGGHLGFPIGTKNTNLIEDVEDLFPVKFRQNPYSGCGEEVEKCFSQWGARAAILNDGSAQKHKLGRGRWVLALCQVSSESVQWFRRSQKCESLRRTTDGQTTDNALWQ